MNATLPVFKGKITGADKVAFMMGMAPKEISRGVFVGFLKTRDQFIGSSKKRGNVSGLLRRRIERFRNWGGRISPTQNSSTWTRQFSSGVRGWVEGNSVDLKTMILRMGILYKDNTKRIHKAQDMMETGGQITSSKYMIFPIYQNLQRIGIYLKTGKSQKMLEQLAGGAGIGFKNNRNLFMLKRGSRLLFYDRDLWEHGDRGNALLFIGTKTIEIKKRWDLEDQWKGFEPRANKLVSEGIDRAVKRLEKKR